MEISVVLVAMVRSLLVLGNIVHSQINTLKLTHSNTGTILERKQQPESRHPPEADPVQLMTDSMVDGVHTLRRYFETQTVERNPSFALQCTIVSRIHDAKEFRQFSDGI